ncbi:Protein-tyrosine phosphatase, receptor/non-receptor type domain and Protein-tyrosine/Dual specificity phosphatase domain and Protein-tyrosine phosphatase, catalytic domain-containing protein [Strongyloides ratti]|uniref:Protein-tyrosine phosphatase, receptor/non-receptor type domain and Protein-tyrosine/Dual specificity phosphatase domain and Protein-tyrosine phosphatase, catalytic domain-containing protein n=1 Tax=Strongyloides ratti TaxID=34506 RepID=A0A090LJR8_STRRB|nr:Protein-tyrosine phosphatase, receptor/non-receptor type domain and Protein-tyrosine/Dual specificity phosphatase domain and Protein-tyrosine phosphatase, catalytic domain-containing protein [Strongyloides ratti]CEF67760.1 Protein-tyrosine phosphatase, receptor/non-receptor type domain and Protein-tyrosine/Dual specificity phosphatase domain and Protein-tyrosine phosphatase, catalytic domain-containing protein [Strongyloides ratti]
MKSGNQKTTVHKFANDPVRYSQNNNPPLKDAQSSNNVEKTQYNLEMIENQKKGYKNATKSKYAIKFQVPDSKKSTSIQKESCENIVRHTSTETDKDKNLKLSSLYYVKSLEAIKDNKPKSSITYSTRAITKNTSSTEKKGKNIKQERSNTLEENTLKESTGMFDSLYARSFKMIRPLTVKCTDFIINSTDVVTSPIDVNVCPKLKDIVGYEVNEAIFDRNLKDFIIPEIKISLKKQETDFLITRKNVIKLDPFFRTNFNSNTNKCRYKDVYCLDKSRVRLKPTLGRTNDFIHANYVSIRDYIDNYKMICAQGPLPNTVTDFWKMIIQENCQNIVMLTQCYETVGKSQVKKCEQYWPLNVGETMKYGNIKINNIKVTKVCCGIQLTNLEVKDESTKLNVSHIIMTNWPDKGAPKIDFTLFIILQHLTRNSPSLIHCSAGIGRTGTLAVIDMLLARLSTDCPPISLASTIQNLRLYRHGAVQTESQYSYIIRVMFQLAVDRGILSEKEITTWYNENDISTNVNNK